MNMLPESTLQRQFRPRLIPTLLTVPLLVIMIWASHWQYTRAQDKKALDEKFEHASVVLSELPTSLDGHRFERVKIHGQAMPDTQILLDGMTHAGQVGYRVLIPIELEDGRWLLVDRGFIDGGSDRRLLPNVRFEAVKGLSQSFVGRIDDLPKPGVMMAPSGEFGWPRRVLYPDFKQLSTILNHSLIPMVLLLDSSQPQGFIRDWHPGGMSVERHLAYSFQWAGLALALFSLYVVSQRREVITLKTN